MLWRGRVQVITGGQLDINQERRIARVNFLWREFDLFRIRRNVEVSRRGLT